MCVQMMALKGQIARLKEKLKLEEKSAAATQQQMRVMYGRIDSLQGKTKVPSFFLTPCPGCKIPYPGS